MNISPLSSRPLRVARSKFHQQQPVWLCSTPNCGKLLATLIAENDLLSIMRREAQAKSVKPTDYLRLPSGIVLCDSWISPEMGSVKVYEKVRNITGSHAER